MTQVQKDDCITVDQAAEDLGFSRATLYNYMNELNIQRFRFRHDRRTYILKGEVARIDRYKEENKR